MSNSETYIYLYIYRVVNYTVVEMRFVDMISNRQVIEYLRAE